MEENKVKDTSENLTNYSIHKLENIMSVNDVLAIHAESLNKKFKDTNKVAYFLDGSDSHQQILRTLFQQVLQC